MGGFLFDELIFGPVKSRRLGVSLGINLLPTHSKFCSYNCIYCECGWTGNRRGLKIDLPHRDEMRQLLEERLIKLKGTDLQPDSITFAGNGEPTMHPQFAGIIDDTLYLRDTFAPEATISVLSNGSMLHKHAIVESLKKIDNNLLKLDGGNEEIIKKINMPLKAFRLKDYLEQLKQFNSRLIIQSMFIRGETKGLKVDNTTEKELADWLKAIEYVNPSKVMVYTIERDTAGSGIEKVGKPELEAIVEMVRQIGIKAEMFA
jgi:wyosine [tRNA(Phe)-imidazoG37] synthetase (radical SAM superfamily)